MVSVVTGQRGIEATGPLLNAVLFTGNVLGVGAALIAGMLLVRGTYAALGAETAATIGHQAVPGASVELT